MAATKQKGGDFISNMFASAIGAYAAKNSTSMGGLLWKVTKYALVILGIILALLVVMRLLTMGKEGFVPTTPSAEGDKKYMTPAGNVVLY